MEQLPKWGGIKFPNVNLQMPDTFWPFKECRCCCVYNFICISGWNRDNNVTCHKLLANLREHITITALVVMCIDCKHRSNYMYICFREKPKDQSIMDNLETWHKPEREKKTTQYRTLNICATWTPTKRRGKSWCSRRVNKK